MDRRDQHGHHLMKPLPRRLGWPIRLAAIVLFGTLAYIAFVYLQDDLSLRRDSGNFWCPDH